MRYMKLCNDPFNRRFITHTYSWWDNAFTNDELRVIQEIGEEKAPKNAVVISPDEDTNNIRRSKVNFIHFDNKTGWIFDRFNGIIEKVNDRYYNYDLNGYHSFQYTTYDAADKGTYTWHMDYVMGDDLTHINTAGEARKLTAVMLLNEPGVDFTGGEFQFNVGREHMAIDVKMKAGTIILFPSFLIHRVKPVLSGIRKSLVIWVEGPKFR